MKKLNIDFKSKKFIVPASITAGVLAIALIVGIVLGVNAATTDIPNFKIGYKTSDIDETVENKDEFTVGQAANLKTGDTLQLYAISESENDSNTGVQPKDAIIEEDIKWEVTSDDVAEDSATTETTTSAETTTDQTDEGSAAASEKVVTVNDKGLVTAENAGTAVVRATIGSGGKAKTSTITVNVTIEGTEAVDQLTAKIEALPGLDALTAEDKQAVDELIREYNALTEEEKSSLSNTDKLLAAQSQVDQLYEASTTTSAPENNASSSSGNSSSSGSGSNSGNTGSSGNAGSASGGSSSGSSSSSGGNKNSGSSSSSSSSGNKKPSSGSSGSSSGSSSSGSSSSKPSTTKPSTFAMSASEIKSYALDQIAKIDGTIYTPEFTKSNAGWDTPLVIYTDDSASEIKAGCNSYASGVYNGTTHNGYNVYVEQTTDSWTGEKCLKVYFLYGKRYTGPSEL